MVDFFKKKEYEEKNSIEDNNDEKKNKNSSTSQNAGKQGGGKGGNNGSASSKKSSEAKKDKDKTEETPVKICPICGEKLDENHKTNIISQEEYESKKAEMIKNRGKLISILDSDTTSHNIGENIKNSIASEFQIPSGNISHCKQAHHLVSINDMFFNEAEFPNLAKIAISSGYDINSVINGIFLPAISANYLKDWTLRDCYRVMGACKMQLHNGPHNYDSSSGNDDLLSSILAFLPTRGPNIEDYSTAVKKEIDNFMGKNQKLFKKCYLTDEDKEQIKNGLNELSNKVRAELNKFNSSPKSCKYYISKIAKTYAFDDDMKTIKIIDVEEFNDGNLKCSAYKLNYSRADNLMSMNKGKEFSGSLDAKFLRFCSDVVFFLYRNRILFLTEKIDFNNASKAVYTDVSINAMERDANMIHKVHEKLDESLLENPQNLKNQVELYKKRLSNMKGDNIWAFTI